MGLKPQDLLILLKLTPLGELPLIQAELADSLGLSRAEVSNALSRCVEAGLLDDDKRSVKRGALLEFVQYGAKYVYAVRPGPIARGILTAHAAPPLAGLIVFDPEDVYVWPSPGGEARGQSVEPLYPSVPQAIKTDPALYEMLALLDALRLGRVREQKIATDELRTRITGMNS